MNHNVLEEFHTDPTFYRNVVANAHRERARAFAAGYAWLADYLKTRFTPNVGMRPTRLVERLG